MQLISHCLKRIYHNIFFLNTGLRCYYSNKSSSIDVSKSSLSKSKGKKKSKSLTMENKFLIIGIGNKDLELSNTRHNAGFICIDQICSNYNLTPKLHKSKLYYECSKKVKDKEYVFIKTNDYINNSGIIINKIIKDIETSKLSFPIKNMLILYDEIGIPLGKVKLVTKPSKSKKRNIGHNGLLNIYSELKTSNVNRLRIGIGPISLDKHNKKYVTEDLKIKDGYLIDYVLSNFDRNELTLLKNTINKRVIKGVNQLIKDEFKFVNAFQVINSK
eukprot:TRINITY_DN10789_c0_g1_i1.p1 TRINITY_DN10789_c0_g1~~TRINITY_DN10789_c0_g1_i1.p1  ORF type:complete len:273 (+),score=3.02 TRINITY_DN10789_c0_g1_i1:154-972(+)